jgi:hypothetical protein
MFSFAGTYNHTVEESLVGNRNCFAHWLHFFWDRIEAASHNEEISVRTFKEGILTMIKPAASWSGRDRFICDLYDYRTKAQILERCEIAINNARKIRSK